MRLTTKIVAGIILSIFLLSITYIVVSSFTDREDANQRFYDCSIASENRTGLEVKPYKTVLLICDACRTEDYFYEPVGTLTLQPATKEEEANKLFMPEEWSRL